ncbi:hypothetical protein FW774_13180 [Pedobacter sp. BS3]|uniref:class I mannose-6-phosphate isomerase n=1 Tax=Pedobacter sp. BS3 TaxID=2567937 RepID=UPI0011F096E4|nr:class I mannose-6-phosphate isomerase [Pedobacter sp. BS3]TZF83236.1 hypothetical protein FW774_13180 [Pedobacter sp. BS3]
MNDTSAWRSGSQPLLPINVKPQHTDGYNIYPYHSVGSGKIHKGYQSLAQWIAGQKNLVIDGFSGVLWQEVQRHLHDELERLGVKVNWIKMSDFLKPESTIQQLVAPFIGESDAVWGTKCSLSVHDFYDISGLRQPDNKTGITILIGPGAAISGWSAPLIYLELPKNELQFRMRAGSVTNFGNPAPENPSAMYKRFYFVDWVIFNGHKKNILDRITIVADVQWKDDLNWMLAKDLKAGLSELSQNVFRVRPWFEPGAWGGQWMKQHINGLNKNEINYAWSFELIIPENGLVFESDGNLLEVSFDFLMFTGHRAVLGKHADIFGYEFPIRFDFLDTWDGGNLSIQCHPSLAYIKEHFGENITQDETYYILDCQKQANVYLGFQEDIDAAKFRTELENSRDFGTEVEITRYVCSLPAKKHDLFLIPNGTVHSAGAGNLVLEISATPYIFTFKMYDWLRLDLNGKPRPINLEHAFNNLRFDRKGDRVVKELISHPQVIAEGSDWQLIHLPTHQEHFYDVHRIEFDSELTIETEDCCHVLMLVEGSTVSVNTANGMSVYFHYAETFVVPAAAKAYTLTNMGQSRAKVIKAFLKVNSDNDTRQSQQYKYDTSL